MLKSLCKLLVLPFSEAIGYSDRSIGLSKGSSDSQILFEQQEAAEQ